MKKGIFLGSAEQIRYVYAEVTAEEIRRHCSLPDAVYTKEDLLRDPASAKDAAYVFSTWGMPVFTEEEIAALFPKLECVFYAAGTVQSFARPFLNRGVRVFSAWAANAVPVAEYTVAQILLSNKGFYQNQRLYKQGKAREAAAHFHAHRGNYGARVGLIGVGMIGSMVAERLLDYRLEVVAYDPFLSDEKAEALRIQKVSLEALFSMCNVVSNHLANNAQTQNMLHGGLFRKMPPNSTFLNTGRGAQVVEADLAAFLLDRPDCTAVLDVTVEEPLPADHPLMACENCFITTHIAGSAGDEVHRMAEYMLEELMRYENGQPTRYSVSHAMLLTMA